MAVRPGAAACIENVAQVRANAGVRRSPWGASCRSQRGRSSRPGHFPLGADWEVPEQSGHPFPESMPPPRPPRGSPRHVFRSLGSSGSGSKSGSYRPFRIRRREGAGTHAHAPPYLASRACRPVTGSPALLDSACTGGDPRRLWFTPPFLLATLHRPDLDAAWQHLPLGAPRCPGHTVAVLGAPTSSLFTPSGSGIWSRSKRP